MTHIQGHNVLALPEDHEWQTVTHVYDHNVLALPEKSAKTFGVETVTHHTFPDITCEP